MDLWISMAGHAFIVYSSYKQITCLRIPSLWRQTSSENILLCSLPYLLTWKKPAQVWDTFHHTRLYQLRFLLLLLCVCVWVWPVCSGQELNGLWSANSVRVCVSYSEVKWLVEQHHWLCVCVCPRGRARRCWQMRFSADSRDQWWAPLAWHQAIT